MLGRTISAVSEIYIATTRSSESAPPTRYRQLQGNSSNESSSRARPQTNGAKMNSTGAQGRIGTNETTENTEKTHKHSHKVPKPHTTSKDIVATLRNEPDMRRQELKEQEIEHNELKIAYFELLKTNENQAEVIAERNAYIIKKQSYIKDMRDLVSIVVSNYLQPYAHQNGLNPVKWDRESILEVLGALSRDSAATNSYAANVSSLTEQVRMLQKEMLAKVDKVQVASDEQLAQEFRVIASLVKSLSRTIHIDDTKDIAEILGSVYLLNDVSRQHWTGRAKKKLVIEAWIWSALVHCVFCTPFKMFGSQCDVLSASWQSIYMTDHCHGWPTPTSLCEAWRYITVESMLELVDRDVITHGKEKEKPKKLEPGVLATRTSTVATIGSPLTKISTAVVSIAEVQNIVDKAFAFALQMSLQRVRLQITYPKVGDKFNADTMKLMPDADGEDLDDGTVAFIVNPGLTKWGDTHGKNLDHRYDIVPALVKAETVPQEKTGEVIKRGQGGVPVSNADCRGESRR
ncbi:hypothetical protein BDW02DRAFT_598808 [Decorospora gaudefroyi]|uniref:Uncharacterized protein n=1 Tax=Decorospora gaudefroyi TaxID=184978 RepID=A0A6A5KGZ8_9PLEO|nr:hypothetical protein BDW02DRAFT_598808 [Decorospora gaudefroyi]